MKASAAAAKHKASLGRKVRLGGMSARCLDISARGDGCHGIFLLSFCGREMIVKSYGRKRSRRRQVLTALENRISGRSGVSAAARYHTEKAVLTLWQANGFEVFRRLEIPAELNLKAPCLGLEYVPGRTLLSYLGDAGIEKNDRLAMLRRFLPDWGRRHSLALSNKDSRLLQEHPSFKHVWIGPGGRLITFDFEIIYTPGRYSLPELIGREIAGYLRSLVKVLGEKELSLFMDEFINAYPRPEFLQFPSHYFFCNPNSFRRVLYALDRRLARNLRFHSKYKIARFLQNRLDAQGEIAADGNRE